MPLCPQIINTPITVSQTGAFTVTSVVPAVPDTKDGLANTIDKIILNSGAVVYYQNNPPTDPPEDLKEGDIWFDTNDGNKQYYYNGTAWVSVQDSSIAAAQAAANAAQLTADGKNRVYRQTSQPTTGPFAEGDLWFDTDDDNRIYRFTSGSWGTAVALGNNALGNLSANKITSGSIDASVITVSNLNAGNISTGTLNADRIASASITGTKIAAGTITASNIATNTITATQIAAGTITAAQIAANTITTSELATGTLSASNITTGTLAATVSLTAQSGTIGGWNISTASIFTGTISNPNSFINSNGSALFAGNVSSASLGVAGTATVGGTLNVGGTMFAPNLSTSTAGVNLRVATGTIGEVQETSASSVRFKENIVDIETVFDLDPKKLLDLPVRAFTYKSGYVSENDDRVDAMLPGFIAEEVDAIYPIATDYGQEGPHSWNERFIIPGMLALIQDLYKEIKTLKGE